MLGLSEARLDWILERESEDHPDQLKFERASSLEERTKFMTSAANWTNVLTGRALSSLMGKFTPKFVQPKPPVAKPEFIGRFPDPLVDKNLNPRR